MAVVDTITSKDLREVARVAAEQGWEVRRAGSGHLKFFDDKQRYVTTASATPSDHRSHVNLRAKLARKGLDITTTGAPGRKSEDPRRRQQQDPQEAAMAVIDLEPADTSESQDEPQVIDLREPTESEPERILLNEAADLVRSTPPAADEKPKRPGQLVREALERCPGVAFDQTRLSEITGLTYAQVHSAIQNLLKHPGFTRPKRGYVVFHPQMAEVRVTQMPPAERTEQPEQERRGRPAGVAPPPVGVRRADEPEPAPVDPTDPIAHLRAVAARHNAEESLVSRVQSIASMTGRALPTTLTVVTTNRAGHLVTQDENGDLYLAVPMRPDF